MTFVQTCTIRELKSAQEEEWLPESYDLRTLRFEIPRAARQQDLSPRWPAMWFVGVQSPLL